MKEYESSHAEQFFVSVTHSVHCEAPAKLEAVLVQNEDVEEDDGDAEGVVVDGKVVGSLQAHALSAP